MTKKILKYTCFALTTLTFILSIINLIFYFSYANTLAEIQSGSLSELAKFELQELKNLYLYRTLTMVPWTTIVSIITIIVSIVSFVLNTKSNNHLKIR